MIEEPPLLRVRTGVQRPNDAQISAFQGVPTGFVNDALDGAGALSRNISLLGEGSDLPSQAAGPALSVECRPGDILPLLGALPQIRPGDIVVNAFGGYQGAATAGDRVTGMMRNCGAVGFVTDGPVRDYEGLVGIGLPVWCTGLIPASPLSKSAGRVGFPVQIGGQEIETGDMIVADRDGVVVVPFEQIDDVIERLTKITALETALDAEVADGLKVPPAILEFLESNQVHYEE
ncbi:RraA family protein [Actibacterium sp. 188UL27-1]|uniref:RraA family protein n=1 Tax=Actibacterium sp. 188UL27-1 TaxID=2786961 RepID=UPI001957146D|nr:RraA family protein [Actibacterium sp. 188UL27-1]MBM7070416.1 RraA family protein [Actibacterium sp. 188UL27-1]